MSGWRKFSRRLPGLEKYYKSMWNDGKEIATFDYKYNGVQSHVILDISNEEWKFVFIKHVIGLVLEIPIAKGYRLEIRSFEAFQAIKNFFEIKSKRGEFHLTDFVAHFGGHIPERYVLDTTERKVILEYKKIDRNSEGIYPIGIVNWEQVHASNPGLDRKKFHRSEENLAKTRELYPEIYKRIKDLDISIRYGEEPGEKTQSIVNGNHDLRSSDVTW